MQYFLSQNIFMIQIFFYKFKFISNISKSFYSTLEHKKNHMSYIFSDWSLLFIETNFRVEANFSSSNFRKKTLPLRKHGSRNLLRRRKYIKLIRVKKMSATRAKLEDITWMLYKRTIIRSKRSLRTS